MRTLFSKEAIDEIMTVYVNNLKVELGSNLKAVILYGSCDRGDYEVGSDIDVFIILQDASKEAIDMIDKLSIRLDWDYDTLIACTIRSADIYNKYYYETLYQNIRREGKVYYGAA